MQHLWKIQDSFQKPLSRARVRTGLFITLLGFFIFIVGAKPDWLGWDRSPVVGFVQIAVFLVGLAIICLGGYIGLLALWGGGQRSIAADIGHAVGKYRLCDQCLCWHGGCLWYGDTSLAECPLLWPCASDWCGIGRDRDCSWVFVADPLQAARSVCNKLSLSRSLLLM